MGTGLHFDSFKRIVNLSMEDLVRDLFLDNRHSIRIKKEEVAVKNLVKIFNAALTISNAKGFAAMSLRDLSREAGLSMGALYTYFSSKEELLDMIQRQGRLVVKRVLTAQVEGIEDPMAKLKRVIQSHLFLSEIMQPWFYFSYMETKNLAREEHKKAIQSEIFTEKIITDILQQGHDQGLFRPVQKDLTGGVIKAMLQDWYLKRWKYAGRKVTVEKYADYVIDLVCRYLVPD